jgi:hypothetical protein
VVAVALSTLVETQPEALEVLVVVAALLAELVAVGVLVSLGRGLPVVLHFVTINLVYITLVAGVGKVQLVGVLPFQLLVMAALAWHLLCLEHLLLMQVVVVVVRD